MRVTTVRSAFFYLNCILLFQSAYLQENYGPYKIRWKPFQNCQGPKKLDCAQIRVNTIPNSDDLIFNFNVTMDCPVTHTKISATSLTDKKKKHLFNYNVQDPCSHFFFGAALNNYFNMAPPCTVKKGEYNLRINIGNEANKYFGRRFFYGSYIFKCMMASKTSNFYCIKSIFFFEKKME